MREFRTGSSRVLITTDLLARGIGKSEYYSQAIYSDDFFNLTQLLKLERYRIRQTIARSMRLDE